MQVKIEFVERSSILRTALIRNPSFKIQHHYRFLLDKDFKSPSKFYLLGLFIVFLPEH
jgi:hypothetical protein